MIERRQELQNLALMMSESEIMTLIRCAKMILDRRPGSIEREGGPQ